jgi:hypothetical protein
LSKASFIHIKNPVAGKFKFNNKLNQLSKKDVISPCSASARTLLICWELKSKIQKRMPLHGSLYPSLTQGTYRSRVSI